MLGRMAGQVNVFDAFGLALSCVTGALKALAFGLGPVPAALMGMVTGIGGGVCLAWRLLALRRGRQAPRPSGPASV